MIKKPQEKKPSQIFVRFLAFFKRLKPLFWQGRLLPAFWTIASVLSIALNIILLTALILVGRQLFALKALIQEGLIEGLYKNFVLMDQAHIVTDILVTDTIPVQFSLPVSTETTVVLTKAVEIPNTWVSLSTAGQGINLSINAPADITLPVNTPLDIKLDITVPVSTTIPIHLPVHVDIPLSQTQLHTPFTGLQNVVLPYRKFLNDLPNSWEDTPFCKQSPSWLCRGLLEDR